MNRVRRQIDALVDTAQRRQLDWTLRNPNCPDVPPETDFLTNAERETLHHAKLGLPSFGEERAAARARIQKRIEARKQ